MELKEIDLKPDIEAVNKRIKVLNEWFLAEAKRTLWNILKRDPNDPLVQTYNQIIVDLKDIISK